MKTSIVIPCIPSHFALLYRAVAAIRNGTVLPDEIIVSLCEYEAIGHHKISELCGVFGDVNLSVVKSKGLLSHGPNRQAGTESSTGDLIIYHDADDLSHPQRVEIIKHFFMTHDIVHLSHLWIPQHIDFSREKFDPDKIPFVGSDALHAYYFPNGAIGDARGNRAYGVPTPSMWPVHGGATSILRTVLSKVHWKDHNLKRISTAERCGEDYEFCIDTLFNFNKSMIVGADLYKYYNSDMVGIYQKSPDAWDVLKY